MHPTLRDQYLHVLGITQWIPRFAPFSKGGSTVGAGVFENSLFSFHIDHPFTNFESDDPAIQLLKKIILAVNQKLEETSVQTLDTNTLPNASTAHTIILSDAWREKTIPKGYYAGPSLTTLMTDAHAKRGLWSALKGMMGDG